MTPERTTDKVFVRIQSSRKANVHALEMPALIATSIALGADAFAVAAAVAAGLESLTFRHTFRLTWHFGLFQSMMTAFGWYGGEWLSKWLLGLNYWIAGVILLGLGINMIRQSLHEEGRAADFDPTRGWSLVGLSVATSIDALAVGLTFGLVGLAVAFPAFVIGITAFIMTLMGMWLGRTAGVHLGEWAERLGGLTLMAIGVKIIFQNIS
ncbi:MAG: manganese efflux pump MntP family protein [Desulfomonilaceae bacterium]